MSFSNQLFWGSLLDWRYQIVLNIDEGCMLTTILYIWIAICVGFVLGAGWAGSQSKRVESEGLFSIPTPAGGADNNL